MRQMPLALAATVAMGITLSACHSSLPAPEAPPPPAAEAPATATPPAMATECNASGAQKFVGQEASPDTIEAARLATGAAIVRTIKPNQPVTMDYRADRLDLRTDDNAMITGASCG